MISMSQAAQDLALSTSTVRHWVHQMSIPVIRKGEDTLIAKDNLSKLREIRSRKKSAADSVPPQPAAESMFLFFQNQLKCKDRQIRFLQEMLEREVHSRKSLETDLEELKQQIPDFPQESSWKKASEGSSPVEWWENVGNLEEENARQYQMISNML